MKLLPLAISALNGKARSELTGLTTKVRLLAITGTLGAISAVFFLVALTVFLSQELGVIGACSTMGAVFALGALIALFLHKRSQRKRQMARVESAATLAASTDTVAGAGTAVLAQAFLRGFLDKKS